MSLLPSAHEAAAEGPANRIESEFMRNMYHNYYNKGEASALFHLLLVEDDPVNQRFTKSILNRSGYRVDVANNGIEAIKMLGLKEYALVLMDCRMPGMNGYEAAAVIRDPTSGVRNHTIPIIALTADSFTEDRDKCRAVGMNDFVPKPVVVAELLVVLGKWTAPDVAQTFAHVATN